MIEKFFNKLLGKRPTKVLSEDIGNFSLIKEDNMKTIKIIDLLIKIANGEEDDLTTEFEFDKRVWNFYKFKNESEFCLDGWLLNQNITITKHKKILEEEKKIPEKLNIEQNSIGNHYIKNEFGTQCNLTKHSKIIADKINEILDYLESKGD